MKSRSRARETRLWRKNQTKRRPQRKNNHNVYANLHRRSPQQGLLFLGVFKRFASLQNSMYEWENIRFQRNSCCAGRYTQGRITYPLLLSVCHCFIVCMNITCNICRICLNNPSTFLSVTRQAAAVLLWLHHSVRLNSSVRPMLAESWRNSCKRASWNSRRDFRRSTQPWL